MAVTFNGTKNSLGLNQKPTGYVDPVVVEIINPEYENEKVFTILKSGVDNATPSVTMDNIFDTAVVGLDAVVEADITADYDATKTVTAHAELVKLTSNVADITGNADWLKTTAVSYLATVKMFVTVV